jgi:uncharacterized protein YdeI (YjbR/CyaY-like superfamily)
MRADEYGWDTILDIPKDLQRPLEDKVYLLNNYNTLSLDHVRAYEAMVMKTKTRAAQDNAMLHSCILNSLSNDAKVRLLGP